MIPFLLTFTAVSLSCPCLAFFSSFHSLFSFDELGVTSVLCTLSTVRARWIRQLEDIQHVDFDSATSAAVDQS
jgi:hypothetical protein